MNYNRIIIVASLIISIASCSVEPINERDGQSNNLSFSVVLDGGPGTKAESLGLYTQDGKVTSFTLEQVPQTKSVQINHGVTFTEIYDSFQVEGRENNNRKFYDYAQYNSSTGLWDLQNSSYLWQPGHVIEIVAAASGRNNDQFFAGLRYNGNPSTATFNYALPETHASQLDYLIGYYKGEIADGTVSLKFNHPLTSLVFEVGPLPLGVTLQVNSITLEGIDAEAICDVTFGENTTYVWRDHSGTTDYTQVIENPQPMVEGDDILDETASFIVIPRTFPANSEARILLNITENGREYDMYAPLAGQVWNPGETNIYQLSYHGENKPLLVDGQSFNDALANISGGAVTVTESDGVLEYTYRKIPNITKIKFQIHSSVNSGTLVNVAGQRPIYMNYDSSTQTVTVSTDDFAIYVNGASTAMFKGLVNLVSIEGMQNLNTKNMRSLDTWFAMCRHLSSIDLSHLDTRNVYTMGGMFIGCASLSSVNLSSFNTEKVVNLWAMFRGCISLSTITFGDNFKLPVCEQTQQMFSLCKSLTRLDLSVMQGGSKLWNSQQMFYRCESLQYVNIENLNLNNVTMIREMFLDCRHLRTLILGDHTTFDSLETKVKMFQNTSSALGPGECTITCTQEAKDAMISGTNMNTSKFVWNIVPHTTEP